MSVELSFAGAVIGFIFGSLAADAAGISHPASLVIAGTVGVVCLGVWIYSPLPDRAGYMAGYPNTGWGWSTDQEGSE